MGSAETVPCPTCGRPVSLSDGACSFDGTPVDSATAIAVASTINPSLKAQSAAESDSSLERIIGEQFGKYVVDELIGRGGMGSVFRVTHAELGNKFALKIMDERIVGSADAHTRFLREARAAARIDHPNVIRVLDHARHPQYGSYLVMELLSGTPLDQVIASKPMLDETRAIDIALQICDALGAAHDQGIVHRDLKPANVFLTKQRGVETVKVMDFGVAKVAADAATLLTRPGSVIGTPLYMSPEQWDNADIDARSDVYSFGVVLYEMLTGRLPVRGVGITEVAKNLATKKVPPPRSVRPDLGEATEIVVLRCLEKEKTDRFPSMRAAADALIEARAHVGKPVARAPSRRTPILLAAAVAAVGLAVYGLGRPSSSGSTSPSPGASSAVAIAPPPQVAESGRALGASPPVEPAASNLPTPAPTPAQTSASAAPAASVQRPVPPLAVLSSARPLGSTKAPAKPPASAKPRDDLFGE
jgi:serine/threonine protein kinase